MVTGKCRDNDLESLPPKDNYTPGIYEVYRGYIVFVFSVKMFVCVRVCVCVNFFSVKDFSGTA